MSKNAKKNKIKSLKKLHTKKKKSINNVFQLYMFKYLNLN